MPKITPRIDLGHILTIAAMLIAGALAYGKTSADLDWIKKEVAKIGDLNDRVIRLESAHREAERLIGPR